MELRRTLTGFKFIGEQIGLLEKEGRPERYIFGFEESYGYLSGSHVRDKDAVNAAMLICEMARWYKRRGKTLYDAMQELYAEFGVYQNELLSTAYEGVDGMARMAQIMQKLREEKPTELAGEKVCEAIDYENAEATGLPAANVLEFRLENGASLMIRPSGTEPKIKVYLSAVGESVEKAKAVNAALAGAAQKLLS